MRRKFGLIISFVISIAALWLVFAEADGSQMVRALESMRLENVASRILLLVVATAVRGMRWNLLTQGRLGFAAAFRLTNIGLLLNNVLPGRLGDLVRAASARRSSNMRISTALATIVLERLFDLIAVVTLLGIALLFLDLPGWLSGVGAVLAATSLACLCILALAARFPGHAVRVLGPLGRVLPPGKHGALQNSLLSFLDGLSGINDGRTLFLGVLLTFAAWLLTALGIWALMGAFWSLPSPAIGIAVTAAAGLGVAVPAAPANIGTLEASVHVVLLAQNLDPDLSRTYAMIMHATSIVVVALLGVIGLVGEGLSFGQLAHRARQPDSLAGSLTR